MKVREEVVLPPSGFILLWTVTRASFLTQAPICLTRLLRGHGQLVDGDRGVSYIHRNLPLDAEVPAARSIDDRTHALSNGNTINSIEPNMRNGPLSSKGVLRSNGTVSSANNRA